MHPTILSVEIYGNIIVNPGEAAICYDGRARDALLSKTWFSEDIGALLSDISASPWQSELWQERFSEYVGLSLDEADIESPAYFANPAGSRIYDNLIFSKGLSIGNIDGSVKKFSDVSKNRVYHISMMKLFLENPKEGKYTLK